MQTSPIDGMIEDGEALHVAVASGLAGGVDAAAGDLDRAGAGAQGAAAEGLGVARVEVCAAARPSDAE